MTDGRRQDPKSPGPGPLHQSRSTWVVDRAAGSPSELHSRRVPEPACRAVTFLEPVAPAVILGRAQRIATMPGGAVRRASGGGAVWIAPGDQLWVDIVVPRSDPLWVDDVNRAAWWVGDCWAAALAACGVAVAEISVHRGALACRAWGPTVCFAGLGGGEVSIGDRKAVGVAQRRTREYALFQCSVPVVWDPAPLVAALGLPPEAVDDLAGVVWTLSEAGIPPADLAAAFVATLPD